LFVPILFASHRLAKELSYYHNELAENEKTLKAMQEAAASNSDNEDAQADVKRFGYVVDESRMMIPDTERRLKGSIAELGAVLRQFSGSAEVSESEWYHQAKTLLDSQPDDSAGLDPDEQICHTSVEDVVEGEVF
jgi:Tubulin binding cofactor A